MSAKETQIFDTAMKSGSFDRYIENLNGASASLGGYIKYMATAEAGTLALSAAQKVATVAAGVLKAALNSLIVLGVVELVKFIGQQIYNAANAVQIQKKAVEELSTAYDDSKKKVQDINTQLSDTQKKIDDLNAKKKLTFVEQDQLDKLKETTKQLQLQEDIAEKEAEKKARELGESALQSYNTEFGGQKLNQNDINQYVTNAQSTGNNAILTSNPSDIDQMIAAYKQFSDLKQKAFAAKDNSEVERYNELLNDIKDSLNGDVSDLQKFQTALEKVPIADRTYEEKKAITDIGNAIDLVYRNIDPSKLKTINFNSVFDDSKFSTIKTELSSLAQQGKLTAQTLNNANYSEFVQAMTDAGLTIPEVINQIQALSKAQNDNSDATDTSAATLSDLSDQYTNLNKEYTELQSIQDTYNQTGYVSADMLATLTANNGELLKYVDIVNGKLIINTQSLQDNAESLKTQIENTIKSQAASQIYGIMQDDLSGKLDNTGTATDNAKGKIDSMGSSMLDAAIKAGTLAESYQSVLNAFNGVPGSKTSGLSDTAKKNIEDVISNTKKEIDTLGKLKLGSPSSDIKKQNAAKSSAKSAESAAKKAANDAKKQAEEEKKAVKDAYEAELKKIENNEDLGLYKTKLNYYDALVALGVKYQGNKLIDQQTKDSLKKTTQDALKAYEEDVYSVSLKELSNRTAKGQTKSGSSQELENLNAIYKNLTTNPLMQLANTEERREELNQKIYENKKQSLENEKEELENEKSLGKINENSVEYLNRLYVIKKNIEKSDLNSIDKAEKLQDINEQIYSATQSYNQSQIDSVDHLVNIGKIQANSIEYVQRLNRLYKSLNLTLDERRSLQEKIHSAEISYIQELESSLSDESIEGSYGSQIKAIQNKIDALQKENDATSKQIALEKAQAALEEAKNQKSISVFRNGKGFVYEADQSDIAEKKQAVADAQLEAQIDKLTRRKETIQSEMEDQQKALEKAVKALQGYDVDNTNTWNDIQDQIESVLDKVDYRITKSSSSNRKDYDDQLNSLDDLTNGQQDDYESQIENLTDYIGKFQTLSAQLIQLNASLALSNDKLANSLNYIGDAYLHAEQGRERANDNYIAYNEEMKAAHKPVKYATGTNYVPKTDLYNVDDGLGQELIVHKPEHGRLTELEIGDRVYNAGETQNILNQLAHQSNPQNMMMRAMIDHTSNSPRVATNNTQKTTSFSQVFPNAVFEIQGANNATKLLNEISKIQTDAIRFISKKSE